MTTAMILYPAIDLLGGHCVRLHQGDFSQAKVFDGDPVEVARRWQDAGATWLHVVDLDGALAGQPKHLEVLRAIAQATGLPIQTGGGLRTLDDIAAALDAGAARVLLGTAAALDPELLATALERWAERIAVSVDSRGGQVTVAGWLEMVSESAADFARRMAGGEVRTLVLTNVERDGTLAGADTTILATLRADLPNTSLIAAGGIASLEDLRTLARAGLDGAVLGRSLYEGAIDLAEALATVHQEAQQDQQAQEVPHGPRPQEVQKEQPETATGGGGC